MKNILPLSFVKAPFEDSDMFDVETCPFADLRRSFSDEIDRPSTNVWELLNSEK